MRFLRALAAGGVMGLGLCGAAAAQSPYDYQSWAFDFEGFYVGLYGGASTAGALAGNVGGVAGVNFAFTDSVLAGVEFQGGYVAGSTGGAADALALARLGVVMNSNVLAYGALGGGLAAGTMSYALGAGAEMAATDYMGVRAEILGIGTGGGLTGARGTLGVLWHLQ